MLMLPNAFNTPTHASPTVEGDRRGRTGRGGQMVEEEDRQGRWRTDRGGQAGEGEDR